VPTRIAADIEFYEGISTSMPTPTRSLLVKFADDDIFAGAVVLASDAIPVVVAGANGRCELEFLHDLDNRTAIGTTFTIHYPPSKEIGRGTVAA